jgi:biopolymer transport protein ExbB/TolQ
MTKHPTPKGWTERLRTPFGIAVALTVLFYAFVHQPRMVGGLVHKYTTEHVTEYIVVALFFWGVTHLASCWVGFRRERLALRQQWLPPGAGQEPVTTAESHLARLEARHGMRETRMGARLTGALSYLCQRRSADGFDEYLRDLADRDADKTHTNYALPRLIVCITPLLGLVGTVVHFGTALGGISFKNLAERLPEVVGAMGTAFNTTTIALGVSMLTMFLCFVTQRVEEGIIQQVDVLAERELAHRFKVEDAVLTPFLDALDAATRATLATMQEGAQQQAQTFWSQALLRLEDHTRQRDERHMQLWTEQTERLDEAVHSLTAAIHLLTARQHPPVAKNAKAA